jgi:hypothetical protein
MADPVGAATSIVGLSVPAWQATRLLLDDIQNIIDAPKAIASLEEDLRSVQLALQALKAVDSRVWEPLGQEVVDSSKFAITSCASACDQFKNDLRHWTKHSDGGKLS